MTSITLIDSGAGESQFFSLGLLAMDEYGIIWI